MSTHGEHKQPESEHKQPHDLKQRAIGVAQDVTASASSLASKAGDWMKQQASNLSSAVSSSASSFSSTQQRPPARSGRAGEQPLDDAAATRIDMLELAAPSARAPSGESSSNATSTTTSETSAPFPHERFPMTGLALLREGNLFGTNRFLKHGTDVFLVRILASNVVLAYGEDAARQLYVPERMTRVGALPPNTLRLLQTNSSIAVMDAEAHHHRKRLWMSVMPPAMSELVAGFEATWMRMLQNSWTEQSAREPVVLEYLAAEALTRATCDWAGIPLKDEELSQRSKQFVSMYDCAASAGPETFLALHRRRSAEKWLRGIVRDIRSGTLVPRPGSALEAFANHRDHPTEAGGNGGELMREEDFVAELCNLVRPVVAVARWVTHAALALHDFPATRQKVRDAVRSRAEGATANIGQPSEPSQQDPLAAIPPSTHTDADYPLWMAQEVRRFYPYFPLLAGVARESFAWRGQTFDKGQWFMLDVNATHRDARLWQDADSFVPERFRDWNYAAPSYKLLPQGGGEFVRNHRCPGDNLAVQLIRSTIVLLAARMEYDVPEQDLTVPMARIPAKPNSGFKVQHMRPSDSN